MRVRALHPGGKTPRKKIDVAWQFPAEFIEYIGVGVQKTRLKQPDQISLPPQVGIWNSSREPSSAGSRRFSADCGAVSAASQNLLFGRNVNENEGQSSTGGDCGGGRFIHI